jgi:aspartate/methionine/tyrosine aminotransferase
MSTSLSENGNGKKETGKEVKESVIRKMTCLAVEHSAVNLSQGFPNEAPPLNVRLALAHAVLTGRPVDAPGEEDGNEGGDVHHKALLRTLSSMPTSDSSGSTREIDNNNNSDDDVLNQYSPPMGRADLRDAIAAYYERLYNYTVDTDNITVTLGATEALACALRTLGKPDDKVVIFEPFHEVYPSQCNLFYLEPTFVTLRPSLEKQTWEYDPIELEDALRDAKILILNSPHNPTGKIFAKDELQFIVNLCLKYNVYIVTDEIYEHMLYSEEKDHILIPHMFPEVADMCLIINSLGKSASATGWRVGWCIHPPELSSTYRGIHDQLVVMSPHPMQYATLTYLALPDDYFKKHLRERYLSRIERLASTLQELGFGVLKPEGAYYLFVKYRGVKPLVSSLQDPTNPMEAAMYLLKEVGVACVPGDNFYGKAIQEEGNQYIRFAACRSDEDITEACRRLRKCLAAS